MQYYTIQISRYCLDIHVQLIDQLILQDVGQADIEDCRSQLEIADKVE